MYKLLTSRVRKKTQVPKKRNFLFRRPLITSVILTTALFTLSGLALGQSKLDDILKEKDQTTLTPDQLKGGEIALPRIGDERIIRFKVNTPKGTRVLKVPINSAEGEQLFVGGGLIPKGTIVVPQINPDEFIPVKLSKGSIDRAFEFTQSIEFIPGTQFHEIIPGGFGFSAVKLKGTDLTLVIDTRGHYGIFKGKIKLVIHDEKGKIRYAEGIESLKRLLEDEYDIKYEGDDVLFGSKMQWRLNFDGSMESPAFTEFERRYKQFPSVWIDWKVAPNNAVWGAYAPFGVGSVDGFVKIFKVDYMSERTGEPRPLIIFASKRGVITAVGFETDMSTSFVHTINLESKILGMGEYSEFNIALMKDTAPDGKEMYRLLLFSEDGEMFVSNLYPTKGKAEIRYLEIEP